MENLKTIVLGLPCGGSSFTYKVIHDFLKKIKPNLSSCHEPSMHPPLTHWWEKFKSFQEVEDNFKVALDHYYKLNKVDILKVNYYTRFLKFNFIDNERLIFVIRAPWQWATSSLNSRFCKDYFYWMTYENKNLEKDNYKHLIDLWIEIHCQILENVKNYKNNILYLNYYDYVDNYKILENRLNDFYSPSSYIKIVDYTNKQMVNTNKRRSKNEKITDINSAYKNYRFKEIKDIFKRFNFTLNV